MRDWNGQTAYHRALCSGDGSRHRRRRFGLLQKPVLGTAGGEYRNRPGVRSILFQIPKAMIETGGYDSPESGLGGAFKGPRNERIQCPVWLCLVHQLSRFFVLFGHECSRLIQPQILANRWPKRFHSCLVRDVGSQVQILPLRPPFSATSSKRTQDGGEPSGVEEMLNKPVSNQTVELAHGHGPSLAGALTFQGLFLGCNAKTQLSVLDSKAGKVVADIPSVGGSDESSVNNKLDQYYSALNGNPGGPILSVVDAKTNKLSQKMPTGPGAHSVAASEANGRVYVPIAVEANGLKGGCGCITMYGAE